MKIQSLEDLFKEGLKDTYDAEKRAIRAYPKMLKAVDSDELRQCLEEHAEITKQQVAKLEEIFGKIGAKVQGKQCAGMKGIIEEGDEMMQEDMEGPLMDLAIVNAARHMEHYEMATYMSLIAKAQTMEDETIAESLQEILEQEEEADRKLSEVAEQLIEQASAGDEEEEFDEEEELDDEDMEEVGEEEEEPVGAGSGRNTPRKQAPRKR